MLEDTREDMREDMPGPGSSGAPSASGEPDALRPFLAALALCAFGAIAVGLSPLFVRAADVGPQASAFWRARFSEGFSK